MTLPLSGTMSLRLSTEAPSVNGRLPDTQSPSPPARFPAMFKRSFLMVALIFVVVFTSAFSTQLYLTRDLPSNFDTGLTIEQAFKSSKVPLLIEFYTDSCATCRKVTPVVHELSKSRYQDRLTVVMMDVEDPSNREIAQLFGVDTLPALYVFDHHHMKKHPIRAEDFVSKGTLQQAIDTALAKTLLQTKDAEAVRPLPGPPAKS